MKRMSKKLFALVLCMALALSLSVAVSAAAATAVSVQESLALTLGTSKKLTATLTPADAEGTVTWSSSDTSKVAVDADGNVTAKAVTTTPVTITATVGGVSDTCAVTVNNNISLSMDAVLMEYDDGIELVDLVAEAAYEWAVAELGTASPTINITAIGDLEYGDLYQSNYYLEDDYYWNLPLVEEFACKVKINNQEYNVAAALNIYSIDVTKTIVAGGATLSGVAGDIDNLVRIVHGKGVEHIYLSADELEGGDIYFDASLAVDEYFSKSDLSKMTYLPNGSGETSVIAYEAYTNSEYDDPVTGLVYLTADKFMLLDYTIYTDEVVELDAAAFEEAYLAQSSSYDALNFVVFRDPGTGKGELMNGDTKISYSKSTSATVGEKYRCYAEPSESAVGIDDLTYEPEKNTKGIVTITFSAWGVNDKNVNKRETGYLRINVLEKADLTVTAGPGELTALDAEWFQEFVAENASSTKKQWEVVRVAISGVPSSKDAGYLYSDNKQLTGNSKTFYMNPKNQLDLNDLYFLGGNKAGVTRADFTIYGRKVGSTSQGSIAASGTIDFVVGAPRRLQYGVSASQTLSFASSLEYLAAMGNNSNTYIIFRGQPQVGGKLIYTDTAGVQTPVVAGEKYYLTATAYGQKTMAGVSFQPSYSSSKIARTVTLPVIAGNAKGNEVDATLEVIVQYASSSTYFSDVSIYNNPNAQRYADSVDYLRVKGITTGNNAAGTTFGLTANITRGEFVTFLYRAAGRPSVVGLTNPFTDVSKAGQPYFYEAILWASKEGITTGRGNGIFDPNANVSYQEVLTFLQRYYVNYQKNPASTGALYGFADANQVAGWALPYVQWAAGKGIVDYYYDGGLLKPTAPATRGDVALFLHRMLTL